MMRQISPVRLRNANVSPSEPLMPRSCPPWPRTPRAKVGGHEGVADYAGIARSG
jgi:hypothetical protein